MACSPLGASGGPLDYTQCRNPTLDQVHKAGHTWDASPSWKARASGGMSTFWKLPLRLLTHRPAWGSGQDTCVLSRRNMADTSPAQAPMCSVGADKALLPLESLQDMHAHVLYSSKSPGKHSCRKAARGHTRAHRNRFYAEWHANPALMPVCHATATIHVRPPGRYAHCSTIP